MIPSGQKHRDQRLAASFEHLAAKYEAATSPATTALGHRSQKTLGD
jgi:hypothetical protein